VNRRGAATTTWRNPVAELALSRASESYVRGLLSTQVTNSAGAVFDASYLLGDQADTTDHSGSVAEALTALFFILSDRIVNESKTGRDEVAREIFERLCAALMEKVDAGMMCRSCWRSMTPKGVGRPRSYCSDVCRQHARRARLREEAEDRTRAEPA